MAGKPWEKYAAKPAVPAEMPKASGKPWEKYAASAKAPAVTVEATKGDDEPRAGELFGSDRERMASGFADPAHMKQLIERTGLAHAHQNASGEWVAQSPDGSWVHDVTNVLPPSALLGRLKDDPFNLQNWKDVANNSHPVNALEKNLGPAYPAAGFLLGGAAAGGASAAVPATAPFAPLAGVAGAGAGQALGQDLRHRIGKYLGVYGADPTADLPEAFKEGITAEAGGKLIGKVPIPPIRNIRKYTGNNVEELIGKIGDKVLDQGRKVVAPVSGFLSGIDKEKVLQLLRNPRGVERAKGLSQIGSEAEDALFARQNQLGEPVGQANAAHLAAKGSENVNVEPAVEAATGRMDAYPTSQAGSGRMSVKEQTAFREALTNELNHIKTIRPKVEASPLKWQKKYGDAPKSIPTTNRITVDPGLEVSVASPEIQSLKGTIDGIDEKINQWWSANSMAKQAPEEINQLMLLRDDLKKLYTSKGPTGAKIRQVDAPYSQFSDDRNLLRGFGKEDTQEATAKSILSETKGNRAAAASRQIPQTVEDIKNWDTKRAYDQAGWMGASPAENVIKTGLATAAGTSVGAATHDPLEALGTLGLTLALTSPQVHRSVLGAGAKIANEIPYHLLPLALRQYDQNAPLKHRLFNLEDDKP